MAKSLQEQLLGAGLTSEKKVKAARKQQHQQRKQKKPKQARKQEIDPKIAQQRAAQVERDRELNREKQNQQLEKELHAQIRQLITAHKQSRAKADQAYHFKDGKTIKKFYVTARQLEQLSRNLLAIVKLDEYELVPRPIAEKIMERVPSYVIMLEVQKEEEIEDDYYKDFQIPDDLMW